MSFVSPLDAFPAPDVTKTLLPAYKGKHWTQLPTPSFTLRKSVIESHCTRMLERIEAMGARFRGHVKTHKCIPVTKMQMGYDLPNYSGVKHDSVVVSTLKEAWEIVSYQERTGERFVNDIIFGLPNFTEDALIQVEALKTKVGHFRMHCDSLDQIELLKKFDKKHPGNAPWSVIVKMDAGTARAGIMDETYLAKVLESINATDNVELYGFYAHSGHSYNCNSFEETEDALIGELETVKKGLDVLATSVPSIDLSKLVVSVGATPTLHSLEHHVFEKTNAKIVEIIKEIKSTVEFHAGNYVFCDLQQVSTGCVSKDQVAGAVVGSVISQYPGRKNDLGELLCNVGVICMSREVSRKHPGFGRVIADEQYGEWFMERMSQEHGILNPVKGQTDAKMIPIGTKVKILPNHACITVNSFNVYYVLDDEDKVCDVWVPWRGW